MIFGKDSSENWSDIDLRPSPNGNFMSGTTGFKINGGAVGDFLGRAVTALGDVNGDDISDFAISIPGASPHGVSGTGEVLVIFGQDASHSWTNIDTRTTEGNFVTGVTGFRVQGEVEGGSSNLFASAVSGLCDINGDGINDLIIGAYAADPHGLSNAGEAFVIFGKDSESMWSDIDLRPTPDGNFISGSTGFKILGDSNRDGFGASLSAIQDINGDGVCDIIASAPYSEIDDHANAGKIYTLFGRDSATNWTDIDLRSPPEGDFTSTVGFTIQGSDAGTNLGIAVSQLGDINGDGVSDIIVSTDIGEVMVIFGCLADNYYLPNVSTFSRSVCVTSHDILSTAQTVDSLSITNNSLTSQSGRIDFSGIETSLTIDEVKFDASHYTGDDIAIDLSATESISFIGDSVLNAGSGYILLPAQEFITGTASMIGNVCYNSSFVIEDTSDLPFCYNGDIRAGNEINDLAIASDIKSLNGKIDFSDVNGTISLSDALLKADNFSGEGIAIDLSTASEFICDNSTIDAGTGVIKLPTELKVTNNDCTFIGDVQYTSKEVPASDSSDSSDSTGAIIGGIIGGIAGAAALIGVVGGLGYYIRKQGGIANVISAVTGAANGFSSVDTIDHSNDDVALEDLGTASTGDLALVSVEGE